MTKLSEYKNQNRLAGVYYRGEQGDFVAIGYVDGLPRSSHPFANEETAEDWCEDWVLRDTK